MTQESQSAWEQEMPEEFQAAMSELRADRPAEQSVQRTLEAAERIHMTSHAWIRGAKNMLICAVGLFGSFAIISWIIAQSLDLSPFIAAVACGVAAWLLIFIAFVSTWIYQNQIAGAVLLDCGAHAGRKLFMTQAVIFTLVAIGFIVAGPRGLHLAWPVFCLTFAAYWAIMSRGRLQVRENGLWQYASLLCWEKIESYDWKGETDATLMIQAKTRFAFLGRGALPVSLTDKPQVDALLQERGIRRA